MGDQASKPILIISCHCYLSLASAVASPNARRGVLPRFAGGAYPPSMYCLQAFCARRKAGD
jgi:hypothetical protein